MKVYALTISIFSIITFVLCRAEELTLPVTTCKRNSNYSTCLKIALEEAWPRFVKGLPEFDFPSLEPFAYKYGKLVFNRNGMYGEGIMTNCTASGLASVDFLDVRTHFLDDMFHLKLDALIPKILSYTYFNGEVNLSGMRVSGTGQFNLTVNEIKITCHITGHVKNDTWTVEHFRILSAIIKKAKIHLWDFFDGNKELNNILEDFLNEYWPSIYRVVAPAMFELLDPTLTDISNRLFSKTSFSKVFP
ncbi:uncharacterized protein [Anoplolepis gracilipes]|uniref:uncharacterized protein n=1 Tax=Anoplolepis gracilipes TaxID=354296 RepID=UPI003B9DD2F1